MDEFETDNRLKNLLGGLPRLRAAGDFERRLMERLASGPASREQAIPAMGYSIAAVAACAAVVALLMTSLPIPPPSQVSDSPAAGAPQSPPSQALTTPQESPRGEMPAAAPRITRLAPSRGHESPISREAPVTNMEAAPPAASMAAVDSSALPATPRTHLEIDQQKTTTGVLELNIPDSARAGKQNTRMQMPKVRDMFGVGVLGKPISSSLADSAKADSLKRLRKQLLQPKAIKKPNE